MHVLVLGAGLAGVTTAWYLARDGHRVTVVERQAGPGMETSFANGGQISVSHPEPWANPGAPWLVLKALLREDAPIKFRPRADAAQWSWGLRFLRECLPGRARRNTEAIVALGLYSRDRLRELRGQTGIEYDLLERGILHLFFTRRDYAHARRRAQQLRGWGMRAELLDRAGCLALEPALEASRAPIAGGLYAPEDESGDAHRFVQALARHAQGMGVDFRYDNRIVRLDMAHGRVTGVHVKEQTGRSGMLAADAVAICLGSHGRTLAAQAGDDLPVYPVKGYSVTVPLAADAGPHVSITDESRRIVCSRLGNRLRIAGTAELAGFDLEIRESRWRPILARAVELFGEAVVHPPLETWAGLRPATPSNVPVIGRGRLDGLYYNTGHGTLGWTLACGSAHAAAEIIAGRRPALDFPFFGF